MTDTLWICPFYTEATKIQIHKFKPQFKANFHYTLLNLTLIGKNVKFFVLESFSRICLPPVSVSQGIKVHIAFHHLNSLFHSSIQRNRNWKSPKFHAVRACFLDNLRLVLMHYETIIQLSQLVFQYLLKIIFQ